MVYTPMGTQASMENLSRDQRDTVFKACTLGPCIYYLSRALPLGNQGFLVIPVH